LPESALALAAQLMHLMGGQVVAKPGEICLTWPVTDASMKTLLVIDDNPGLIRLFRRYMTGHAWRVVEATSLSEAIAAADEHPPDAIVLDVMLPRQDGWEVLRALKLHERTRHAPVIICSVMHQPELASQLGAAGYLKKPVTQAQLLQALALWT
ncbi:MAG: response regulator, partial [Anaerolineae bacterium]|nr:response regulator [Anaerolineae bacterium]